LRDSVYNYTSRILGNLGNNGLMPEYVQIGNEINPGLLLPQGNRWNGNEANMILLLNSGIKAVRDAGASNSIKPKNYYSHCSTRKMLLHGLMVW